MKHDIRNFINKTDLSIDSLMILIRMIASEYPESRREFNLNTVIDTH